MADIKPFRGWRYNKKLLPHLKDLIVESDSHINKDILEGLYDNPYNSIHLTWPKNTSEINISLKRIFNKWCNENILIRDKKQSIYVYYQYFKTNTSTTLCKKGFLCSIDIENENAILSHESILSKEVFKHIRLLESLKIVSNPIHALYRDSDNTLERYMDSSIEKPLYNIVTKTGIEEKLSIIDDPSIINKFIHCMKDRKLLIVDGHHRYNASIMHKRSLSGKKLSKYYYPFYISNIEKNNFAILPIHRIIEKPPNTDLGMIIRKLNNYFWVQKVDSDIGSIEKIIKNKKQHLWYFYRI